LEIPFAALAITYVIYIFAEKDIKRLLFFSLLFRSAWLIIPQIKYPWFQGVAVDQHIHYRLAEDIYDSGFIPSGRLYSGTPLMHVFLAAYSLTTGLQVVDSFKYLPILWWGAYPLLVYMLMKKSKLGKDNPSILKYAVVVACIPAKVTLSYVVVSTLFGAFLVFLLLYQIVSILKTNASQYWLLGIICSLALVSAHTYSSTTLLFVLSFVFLFSTFVIKSFRLRLLRVTFLMFLVVLNLAWLLYQAPVLFGSAREVILTFLHSIQGLRTGPAVTGFKPRFFELDILSVVRTLAVFHGADLFFLFLMMIGVVFWARKLRSSSPFRFLWLYVVFAWVYYFIQLLFGRGYTEIVEYNRIIEHTLSLSPIFAGLVLYHLEKKARSLMPAIVAISLLMVLAPIQLYPCQPIIPPRTVGEGILSSVEPLVDVGMVNSVYQRSLIRYAEKHIEKGFIASELATAYQAIGLSNHNFSEAHIMHYYPFSRLIDNATKKREYDYFLIHFAGKAGVIMQPAEIRTTTLIKSAILNSSVTYNNGESYILQRPFMYDDG